MIVSTLATTQGGSATALQRQEIAVPTAGPGGDVYRRVLFVRLPTGSAAERIELADDAVLRVTFAAYEYDAVDTPVSALRASRTTRHQGVLVSLDAPRRVTRIGLSAGKAAAAYRLELYRLDGDTPSVEPTVSVVRSGAVHYAGAAGGAGGGSARSRARRGGGAGGSGAAASAAGGEAGMMLVAGGDAGPAASLEDGEIVMIDGVALAAGPFAVDLVDARFLVRARDAADAIVPLSASDLTSVTVRSHPRNPRLRVALPADPASPAALDPAAAAVVWSAPGEIGADTPASAGAADAGGALRAELARGLDRFASLLRGGAADGTAPPPLPAGVDAALVFESDAPCVLEPGPPASGTSFRLGYALVRQSFDDGREKAVLRFEPGRVASADVPFPLPAGAVPIRATVELDSSLPPGRPAGGGDGLVQDALATATGVRVTPERAAAQPLLPPEALTVAAVALGVLPLRERSEITVELRADAGSGPAGSVLSSVRVPAGAAGRRRWLLARLAEPLILGTLPHWLVVRVAGGPLLWLARPGTATLRTLDAVTGAPLPAGAIEGLGALHALLSTSGAQAAAAPFSLSLAQQAVPLEPGAGGRRTVDLTAAASAVAAGAAGGPASFPLRFEAAGPGIITVYPPRLTYALAAGG